VNVAPTLINVPASVTINEEEPYTFTAIGSDHDLPGQTLTYSLNGEPAGATIGSSSGAFSWTPDESQGPGVYTFDVIVSDGTLTATKTITITVAEVNVAPAISGVPTAATINEEQLYSFTATATDHDDPAQTLTFSLSGQPSGASINPTSGVFNWTPDETQGPGSYTFGVVVSDGDLTDTQSITIVVLDVNEAPTLSGVPTSVTIDELHAYTFTASGSDSDVPSQ